MQTLVFAFCVTSFVKLQSKNFVKHLHAFFSTSIYDKSFCIFDFIHWIIIFALFDIINSNKWTLFPIPVVKHYGR